MEILADVISRAEGAVVSSDEQPDGGNVADLDGFEHDIGILTMLRFLTSSSMVDRIGTHVKEEFDGVINASSPLLLQGECGG